MSNIEKLNKTFGCGQILLAEDLNDIKNKINEIIDEGVDGESGGEISLNLPLSSINGSEIGLPDTSDMAIVSNGNGGWKYKKVSNTVNLNSPLAEINTLNSNPSGNGYILVYNKSYGWGYEPKPSGGNGLQETTYERERIYFLNLTKGSSIPPAPNINTEYNLNSDTFSHTITVELDNSSSTLTVTQVWSRTNLNPNTNLDTYGIWVTFSNNNPISIVGPIKLTGDDGTNGSDSELIEWVYKRFSSKPSNEDLLTIESALSNCYGLGNSTNNNIDFTQRGAVPSGWNNHPSGVDSDNKYEYTAFRTSTNVNGSRTWGTDHFHGPLLWSAYGEKGTDGDGIEYIFYIGTTAPSGENNRPETWTNDTGFLNSEYIRDSSSWDDEPFDLSNLPQGILEWVSIRKKQNGEWQPYSVPKLWNRMARDGIVDGYVVDLSNENMPVGTSSNGDVDSYSNSCRVLVSYNGTPLEYLNNSNPDLGKFYYTTGTPTRNKNVETSENDNIINVSTDNDIINVTLSNFSNFDEDYIRIPITITLPNSTVRYSEITLFGIATGDAGAAIDLCLGASLIGVDLSTNSTNPDRLTVGVKISKGDNINYYEAGSLDTISRGYTFKYYYDDDDNNLISVSNSYINPLLSSYNVVHGRITFIMYYNDRPIDYETLPYIKDGRGISNIIEYYRPSKVNNPSNLGSAQTDNQGLWVTNPTLTNTSGEKWSSEYKFLFVLKKTIYTYGEPTWSVISLDRIWEENYIIYTTENNYATIDDLTTNNNALRKATEYGIKVMLRGENITNLCGFVKAESNLPNVLDYDFYNIDVNSSVLQNEYKFCYIHTMGYPQTIPPGIYNYKVKITYNSNTIGLKQLTLKVDESISNDGSTLMLNIQNNNIEYNSNGTLKSNTNPIIKVSKIFNSESPNEYLNFTYYNNSTPDTSNLEVGSLHVISSGNLPLANDTSSKSKVIDINRIVYKQEGYDLKLYKVVNKNSNNLLDEIDCVKINCYKDISNGVDGYTLNVIPFYAIINEIYTEENDTNGNDGLSFDYLNWRSDISLLLRNNFKNIVIEDLAFNLGTVVIVNDTDNDNFDFSSTTKKRLKITSLDPGDAILGKITFNLYSPTKNNPEYFRQVEIPVYLNRIGSFERNIKNGVEAALGEINTWTDIGSGNVLHILNLYEEINSAKGSFTSVSERLNGVETDMSQIELTAKQISLIVYNGWNNYIENPILANNNIPGSTSLSDDLFLNNVVQITGQSGNNLNLYFLLDNDYENLTGKTVTWFCIVKPIISESNSTLNFVCGDSSINGYPIVMSVTNENFSVNNSLSYANYVVNNANNVPTTKFYPLKNGWYMCYTTAKLLNNKTIINGLSSSNYTIGFTNLLGTWQIYYVGIISGNNAPTLGVIDSDEQSIKTGINLSEGTIDMQADNFKLRNNNDEETLSVNSEGDLWIKGEFDGKIKSVSGIYHNVCINGFESWFYCPSEVASGSSTDGFEAGKYYTAELIRIMSDNAITLSPGLAGNSGFVPCVYNADIVVVPNRINNLNNDNNVILPVPDDFKGKIIEIYDSRLSNGTDIYVKCCNGGREFMLTISINNGNFEHDTLVVLITCSPKIPTHRFLSCEFLLNNSQKYYWLKLPSSYYDAAWDN